MNKRVEELLGDITQKIDAGQELTLDDVVLFNDVLAIEAATSEKASRRLLAVALATVGFLNKYKELLDIVHNAKGGTDE